MTCALHTTHPGGRHGRLASAVITRAVLVVRTGELPLCQGGWLTSSNVHGPVQRLQPDHGWNSIRAGRGTWDLEVGASYFDDITVSWESLLDCEKR